MIRQTLVGLLMGGVAATAHAAPHALVTSVLQPFYTWMLTQPSSALPTAEDRERLSQLLSPSLMKLLQQAGEMEARCIASTPEGEKGHIIEGALFTGVFESPTEVMYGTVRQSGHRAQVKIGLAHVDESFAKGHPHRTWMWNNQVILKRTADKRWLIHDIEFERGNSLYKSLNGYIQTAQKECKPKG